MNTNIEKQIERAKQDAISLGLIVRFIRHSESGRSTADAEKALGVPAECIIKSLIMFSPSTAEYFGFIISGSSRLNIKKACRQSGVPKLKFASPEQVEALTGFRIGGVPPTSLRFCKLVLIDSRVFTRESAIGAGGDEHCGMEFSPAELAKSIGARTVDISE